MSDHKKILVYCLIILFVQNYVKILSCSPVQNSETTNNDTNDDGGFTGDESSNSVTEHGVMSHDSNSRIVDLNNLDESNLEFMRRNNINLTALRVEQDRLRGLKSRNGLNGNVNAPAPLTQTRNPLRGEDHHRREYEEGAIDNIKNIIETALIRNSSMQVQMPSNAVKHEMAFNAECDMPRNFNESVWFSGDAWNIYFKIPNKRYTLQSAVLRIYKKSENDEASNCTENAEELIRIVVNVYERRRSRNQRGEKTSVLHKKLCSSSTVSRKYEGWVEMDIKMAVKQWEKPNRNLGLSVEVQDHNENTLKSLDFFHPIDCNQPNPFHGLLTDTLQTPHVKWITCPSNQG
ncbi:uncharacterized protein LOC134831276 isoform X2 [Culicoides brevitarsis]|uniref:uncharacterized protein LOC134831276 isoform X2 n=1 Tax=Culicoides brevitarsis TaxID=469753 RepID=UPI00307C8988